VEYAEHDFIVHPLVEPMIFSSSMATSGTLRIRDNMGGVVACGHPRHGAWNLITSASNVIVASLTPEARYTHEDLAANMWVNPGRIVSNRQWTMTATRLR